MATCPNKNTKEWREVMSLAQNNEALARELWVKKGYADVVSLNTSDNSGLSKKEIKDLEKDQAEKAEFKTDLQILMERTKVHLIRKINALQNVKVKDARIQKASLEKISAELRHQLW